MAPTMAPTMPPQPQQLRGSHASLSSPSSDDLSSRTTTTTSKGPVAVVYGNVFLPDPVTSSGQLYGSNTNNDDNDDDDDNFKLVDNHDQDNEALRQELVRVELLGLLAPFQKLEGTYVTLVDTEAPFHPPTSPSSSSSSSKTLSTTTIVNYEFTRNHPSFEAVNAYYHVYAVLRYVHETLGLEGVHPHQYEGGVRVDPHGLGGRDNSHYLASTQTLAFGDGGVDDAEDAEVLVHELSQGIHIWLTAGEYSRVEGLSEGFGDYMAASYGRSLQPSPQPSQPQSSQQDPKYHWIYNWDGHNEFWNGWTTVDDGRRYPQDLSSNQSSS